VYLTQVRDCGLVALLVVAHHTALMYGAIGSWLWRERNPDNSFSSLVLTFFCTLNQAWFMVLFFLLAGTYVPAKVPSYFFSIGLNA
jgi:hypothetical protein